jgi:glutamate---cysteine ligase / carboxylate-amine ligase
VDARADGSSAAPLARQPSAQASTFGIEEEYFLVRASGNLLKRVPSGFLRSCRRRFGPVVCAELLQSQIEVASPVFTTSADAHREMAVLRHGLSEEAEGIGCRLVAAGSHPLARWSTLKPTAKPRYSRLIDDFQIIGRRNVLCGLHIHAGVPADVDRVALMNRLMPWLPLLLALSTSSPFWECANTGLLSYRQAAYDEWPRTGIPDFFDDDAAYAGFVDLLVERGAIPDASYLWWAIRPATRFPTLELRITDCCTRVEDSVALASAFRCLVRAHLRQPDLGAGRGAYSRRLIDENRWRAKRWGIEGSMVEESSATPVPVADKLTELRALVADDAVALDCEADLRHLTTIMVRGTSAHQQLAVYRETRERGESHHAALVAVVDWLARATVGKEEG